MSDQSYRPEQLIIGGDSFRNADPDTISALTKLIKQSGFDVEIIYPIDDVAIYRDDFLSAAHGISTDPFRFGGQVWSALTAGGRILKVAENINDPNEEVSEKEQFAFYRLPLWRRELCFDAEAMSWKGLSNAYERGVLGRVEQPFGKKSVKLVGKVLENKQPE